MTHATSLRIGLAAVLLVAIGLRSASVRSDAVYFAATPAAIAQAPLYLKDVVPPLNMLVMGKDQKVYNAAYNDASDLDGDGKLDVGYRGWDLKSPAPTDGSSKYKIDYYGYFNSYDCYSWNGTEFVPASHTDDKTCSGTWSGDFLNYLTMSRMDALRRVLYGGWRQVDTADKTILQGAFFPQDGHSWGKEYNPDRDGYDITKYAQVSKPSSGKYVLFAVTTVTGNGNTYATGYQAPILRVMQNSQYRIWNWLSIEGPVAGNECFNSANTKVSCISTSTMAYPGTPASESAFDSLQSAYAIADYRYGTGNLDDQYDGTGINCYEGTFNCNPYTGDQDQYLTIIQGTLHIKDAGNYQFAVDGDDAVDFEIAGIPNSRAEYLGDHDWCDKNGTSAACFSSHASNSVSLSGNTDYTFTFRHVENGGGSGYRLLWKKTSGSNQFDRKVVPFISGSGNSGNGLRKGAGTVLSVYDLTPTTTGGASRADYAIRVQACTDNADLNDAVCKLYPNGHYKPTGILHDYGENQRMYFGLITGTQYNNLEGGVLRRNVSNFADEVNAGDGTFKSDANGIVNTINRFRMIGGSYNGKDAFYNNLTSAVNWSWNGGTGNCPTPDPSEPLSNGQCRMWGNPLAEMLYESMRYFAGAGKPTTRFATGGASQGTTEETTLGLKTETWQDPYKSTANGGGGYPTCAKPYQTIISDINPSYDGDLPGSAFSGATTTVNDTPASISSFSASTEADAIWTAEYGGSRKVFIGEAGGVDDGGPTAKTASSFRNIRGLSPEEPTKQGTYYSASVARFGRNNPINSAADKDIRLGTYSIALASPLPRIEFPVGGKTITLIPFGKTAGGTFGSGTRKPTNNIVAFYVESFANLNPDGSDRNTTVNKGLPYAKFRVSYEDSEQGNDYDMDAIILYEVQANDNGSVTVNLTSEYAAGSANQNLGYVLSGTTQDGVYLDVRDKDSSAAAPYDLNTPPGMLPGACKGKTSVGDCAKQLPLTSSRTFTPSVAGSDAIQLENPLWYAAKYGAPGDLQLAANGDPSNYFLVTNPLYLRTQLSKAFEDIANKDLKPGVASISGARVGSGSFTLQPAFNRYRNGKDWTGNLSAYLVNSDGTLGNLLWDAQSKLPLPSARKIFTVTDAADGTSAKTKKVEFKADKLGSSESARDSAMGINYASVSSVYGANYSSSDFVAYLRGDQSKESPVDTSGTSHPTATAKLRHRTAVLGDIIGSEPVIASPRNNYGYGYYSDAMFSGYTDYLEDKLDSKATVAYVGANDGMLHAFDAGTQLCSDKIKTCATSSSGSELFAFIPNGALSQLGELPKPDGLYSHRYLVDGQVAIGDVKDGTNWKTILVGTMAGGGRSVFALDITNPTNFGTGNVLWERTASGSQGDKDLGNVYGKPLVVPLQNGKWGVLFGNGYGGSRSDPSLYILDAMTGAQIAKLTADDGNPAKEKSLLGSLLGLVCTALPVLGDLCVDDDAPFNGLGQITAIDSNRDGKVDTVYGGDLQGELWRFDLSGTVVGKWGVGNGGKPLFRTQSTMNAADKTQYQPITGGIRVAAGPGGTGVLVYFGTGRYFTTDDNSVPADPQVQSLYAVLDTLTGSSTLTRADLVSQTISQSTEGDGTVRDISRNPVFYYGTDAKRGWYLDLKLKTGATFSAVGERFIGTPLIQAGRVFFTTYTPTKDGCNTGGGNVQYGLDLMSGVGTLANVQVTGSGSTGGGTQTQTACTGANCGAVSIKGQEAPIMSSGAMATDQQSQVISTCDPSKESCATYRQCWMVIQPSGFKLPRACGRQSWRQLK